MTPQTRSLLGQKRVIHTVFKEVQNAMPHANSFEQNFQRFLKYIVN